MIVILDLNILVLAKKEESVDQTLSNPNLLNYQKEK
jgi:hypothetical protein